MTDNNQNAVKIEEKQQIDSVDIRQVAAKQTFGLTDITEYLSAKIQTFNINPNKDTLLKCSKGTMVYIPANSLKFQDGSSPSGQVTVDIKECYSLADFIGDELTTTSGDRILQTGGMVNISVSSFGKPLTMKRGKEYALYFPKQNPAEEMNLFYGDRSEAGKINWIPKPEDESKSNSNQVDSVFDCKIRISGHSWRGNYKIMETHIQTLYDYFQDNFEPPSEMKREFCKEWNGRFRINITLDVEQQISDISFDSTNFSNKYDSTFTQVLKEVLPLADKVTSNLPQKNIDKNWFTLYFTVERTLDEVKFKKKYATFKEKVITKIDQAELNYYVLTATKFGWINCDIFWDTPGEKTEFFVNIKIPTDTKVIIAFKDIRSVMQGTLKDKGFVFSKIPINQAIKVIGISYDNNKPTMAVAETITDKDGFELTAFKEFTLNELEAELNKMN